MSNDIGIVLVAVGSIDYGKMAFNMALSIKDKIKDLPIALICDENALAHIRQKDMWVFDVIIEPEFEQAHESFILNPFKLKTSLYDLSPFQRTLYLDVDGLLVGSLDALLSALEKAPFQIQEVGRYTKATAKDCGTVWTKVKQEQNFPAVWDLYGLSDEAIYPEYNSSLIWFEKSDENKKYFDEVKRLYGDRKFTYTKIGTFYPDEMAFGLASAITGRLGTHEKFKPIFFAWENKIFDLNHMEQNFAVLGLAGGMQVGKMVQYYNSAAKALSARHGADYFPFNQKSKIFFNK